MWKPDIIVIGPAGAKAFLNLGALQPLFNEPDFFSNIKKWIGVSAGAAICLLIACGYMMEEIINICLDVNLTEDFNNINISEVKNKLGLIKNKTVENKLNTAVIDKFTFIPTLKQLYCLTGFDIALVSYNIDKLRSEHLNKDNNPDLSCVEACLASLSIPILMQPRKINDCIYVDGALGDPYPINDYDINGNKILGIYVVSEEDYFTTEGHPMNFLYKLVHVSMKRIRELEIKFCSKNVRQSV